MGQKKSKRRPSAADRLSHEEARELLHAYTYEALIGGLPEARYPSVAAHLARCAVCRADLEELLEMTRTASNPTGTSADAHPRPDLSRLPRPWQKQASTDRPWFVDRFRRLWLELSQPLLHSWQPSPLLGLARGALLFAYQQEAISDDPGLRVGIYAEDDPAMTLVSITIDVPDQHALDQSGLSVAIYIDDTIRQTETDTSGTARFSQIPRDALGRLRLAITLDRSA